MGLLLKAFGVAVNDFLFWSRVRAGHRASAARARVVGNSPEGLHVGSTRLVRALSWSSESIYALARDAWDVVSRWILMTDPTAFMLRRWKLG
ncbi:hypothetical protein F3Y22_tig00111027pilonHSYRG00173 [Hibiscus syriacus]|uniref:Uncharacterized protein n=1 Tax=Hibiscus syriacus TaxID=106335 RepID=A0A6A2Z512_HIBSY|nr:hypothetical protein F3Y22_tig00111027pilonHSYRG00173 [Hibiscus syriacus]